MIPFAVIAVAMLAIALAWIVVPLLRQRPTGTAPAREASNAAILRDQLRELEADLQSGALSAEAHAQARRELEQRVLQEAAPAGEAAAAAPSGAGRRTVWAIVAILPVAAIALYGLWGNFNAFVPEAQIAREEHPMTAAEIEPLIAKLVARLEQEPDNADGWLILARTYYSLNRYQDATKAFERAAKLIPNDASVLVDYADALGATQQSLQGRPTELVNQALQIDRRNWKALALAGTAAFDRKDYKQAVAYWEEMKAVVPPQVPFAQSIDASIAEARQLGGMPPAATPRSGETAIAANAPAPAAAAGAAPAGSISKVEGTVSLSPKLASNAKPDDAVFIFARAAEGPRMPLAIIRRQVKDLPAKFTLDDSMAMTPTATLSSVPQIVVGARVSRSGTAMPQSGDLEGYSAPVTKAGATSLDVVIDRAVP